MCDSLPSRSDRFESVTRTGEGRRRRWVVPIAVAFAGLIGCTEAPGQQPLPLPDRREHADGDGVLSASAGVGGFAMDSPGTSPWSGSFGGFVLCSTDPGTSIELQAVRVEFAVEPLDTEIVLRTTPPATVREAGNPSRLLPFISNYGTPPDFAEEYADWQPLGRFTSVTQGAWVRTDCDDSASILDGLSDRRLIGGGLTELVFVMAVDKRGGEVTDAYVEYLADDQPTTLHMEWVMTACGTDVDRRACAPDEE